MALILSALKGGTLTLTLNRPERANAFNLKMLAELLDALQEAETDSQVRCIVLTGAGKVFGAGEDLQEIGAAGGELSFRKLLTDAYHPLILKIRQILKPVVASVNGACAGASLGVALACDLRLAAESARFVVGFAGVGMAPDSAVSLLLPSLIGLGRATEFAMTNIPITAAQALDWGMVNRVVPLEQLPSETEHLTKQLAVGPLGAYGLAKQAFNRSVLHHLDDVLAYEADLQEQAGKGAEYREGMQAFLEKRPPKYS
jgi:2-(1,2-epoxy-1,2-dihydrophenyl)acetyl-CoA isomerase